MWERDKKGNVCEGEKKEMLGVGVEEREGTWVHCWGSF